MKKQKLKPNHIYNELDDFDSILDANVKHKLKRKSKKERKHGKKTVRKSELN